jgi:hypothetical protein
MIFAMVVQPSFPATSKSAEFEGIGRNKENPDRPETIGALSRHARPIHLVPAMRLGMAGSVAPVPTSCSNTNTVIRDCPSALT